MNKGINNLRIGDTFKVLNEELVVIKVSRERVWLDAGGGWMKILHKTNYENFTRCKVSGRKLPKTTT